MAGGTVGWHFFDVESGLVPDDSSPSVLPGEGRGRIVVLAATPFAVEEGWAARAAVRIAQSWSEEGLQVFLMDLGLEDPSLHEELGLPNEEGVSDAFLFGASIQHIARPAMDEAFFFAPAGSKPGDPEEVLGHPRWNDLAGGFSETDATLLLFLPMGLQGAAKILSRATDVLFFSAQGESPEAHLGPASIKMVANVGPLGSPPEELIQEEGEAAGEGPAAEEDLLPSLEEDGGALEGAEGSVSESEEEPGPAEEVSAFDFTGDFELADGFGEEVEEEEDEVGVEEIPHAEDQMDVAEEAVEEEIDLGIGDDIGLDVETEAEFQGDFGDEVTMGSSLVGEDEEEETTGLAPEFGADFVEFTGEEEESPSDFGGDLVQGADFGGPATEVTEAPEEASYEEEVPAGRIPEEEESGPPREPPKRRPPPKKPFPFGRVAAIVAALAVAGAAAGAATGYINIPGLSFLQGMFGDVPDPQLTLAGPQPNEEVLRFSLVLFNYDEAELGDAVEMLEALRSRLPDLLFFLSPEEEDGEILYSLMAGPAYDRIEADALRSPISEVLTREDPNSWTIRETPRAFYLGERESLADAEEYMRSLGVEGVHPYILHVTYPDGTEAFEILAGAYQGVMDARFLQLKLRDSGLRDLPLIERRGRFPE